MHVDVCRRIERQSKFLKLKFTFTRPDGKQILSGLPNAFSDAEGRPFGYIDELREIGWPTPTGSGERLVLENLLITCTPAEGGRGSWLYAHHFCASWSDGVVKNQPVCFFLTSYTHRLHSRTF